MRSHAPGSTCPACIDKTTCISQRSGEAKQSFHILPVGLYQFPIDVFAEKRVNMLINTLRTGAIKSDVIPVTHAWPKLNAYAVLLVKPNLPHKCASPKTGSLCPSVSVCMVSGYRLGLYFISPSRIYTASRVRSHAPTIRHKQ